jgi:hypothetical protein
MKEEVQKECDKYKRIEKETRMQWIDNLSNECIAQKKSEIRRF